MSLWSAEHVYLYYTYMLHEHVNWRPVSQEKFISVPVSQVPFIQVTCTSNLTYVDEPLQRGDVGILAVYDSSHHMSAAQLYRRQRVGWRAQRGRRQPPAPHFSTAWEQIFLQLKTSSKHCSSCTNTEYTGTTHILSPESNSLQVSDDAIRVACLLNEQK